MCGGGRIKSSKPHSKIRARAEHSCYGASPSDCLVLYPGHSLGESYPTAGMQSVSSAAPADQAKLNFVGFFFLFCFNCISIFPFFLVK